MSSGIATAVIGCGFMGENHAHAVSDHALLSLDSVVDVDAERAEEVAATYDADVALTAFEAALSRADAAVIATPEPYHHEQATAAIEAGVHTLVEKPIASDIDAAADLVATARDAAVETGVSFVLRYDEAYGTVHDRVDRGAFGEFVAARLKRGITIDESRRIGGRGHPLFYMNIHDVDALLACRDVPVTEVVAYERRGELDDVDVPDAVQALLRFSDGATATLEGYGVLPSSTPGGIDAAFEVVGTEGTATVTTPGNAIETLTGGFDRPDTRHWPTVDGRMRGAVREQINRFAAAITGDESLAASVHDGYRAQRVCEAIRLALDREAPVDPRHVGPTFP